MLGMTFWRGWASSSTISTTGPRLADLRAVAAVAGAPIRDPVASHAGKR
jgi:hypothetical protein